MWPFVIFLCYGYIQIGLCLNDIHNTNVQEFKQFLLDKPGKLISSGHEEMETTE